MVRMLSRGDNLGVGGEQDVEAKALRSVRWYARRWREKLSQTWLQSCRKMPSPAASCWASDPQRWIDIKRNQCRFLDFAQKSNFTTELSCFQGAPRTMKIEFTR